METAPSNSCSMKLENLVRKPPNRTNLIPGSSSVSTSEEKNHTEADHITSLPNWRSFLVSKWSGTFVSQSATLPSQHCQNNSSTSSNNPQSAISIPPSSDCWVTTLLNCAVTAHVEVSATIHEEYAEISFLYCKVQQRALEHIVVSARLEHEMRSTP